MNNIFDYFRLKKEKEDFSVVYSAIRQSVIFKGTNLWILVFAIFIASLGLNVNSPAVIIGAMLISPLMGPIIGFGFGMGINDLPLMKKALFNFLFASVTGLVTSTVYFSISPLNEAHSEILARTSPTIYDVLIAMFGGLAGILAMASKNKGNVIPGVAIATALMPPLCTAGYGVATLRFSFFIGAFYLFVINVVFIALATFITVRLLKFPLKQLPEQTRAKRTKNIILGVVLITLLPSIYFGYDIVRQSKFQSKAAQFIEQEAVLPNNFLLKKTIDAKMGVITLTFGGQYIDSTAVKALKKRLLAYGLNNTRLDIRQGFSYVQDMNTVDRADQRWTSLLAEKEKLLKTYKQQLDSIEGNDALGEQLLKEVRVQFPAITQFGLRKIVVNSEKDRVSVSVAVVALHGKLSQVERSNLSKWLKVRIQDPSALVFIKND